MLSPVRRMIELRDRARFAVEPLPKLGFSSAL
jgi:hypothetical protein